MCHFWVGLPSARWASAFCRHLLGLVLALALPAIVLFAASSPVHADSLRIKGDQFIQQLSTGRSAFARVIVQLDGPVTSAHAKRLKAIEARIYRSLPLIDAVAVRMPSRN